MVKPILISLSFFIFMKEHKALYTLVEITGTIDYFTQAYLKNYPERFFCLILDYLWSLHLRGKNVLRKSPFLSWAEEHKSYWQPLVNFFSRCKNCAQVV